MLFDDIRRVESLAKVQTALATLPSQLFHRAQDELAEIGAKLKQKQEEGRKLHRQLLKLKEDVGRNFESTSDLYDRVVQLTQELKAAVNNTLLTSHHLISPHSRFGVFWRITVVSIVH
jgi:predicted  nucleic acid-binding Zn-ribbon protein